MAAAMVGSSVVPSRDLPPFANEELTQLSALDVTTVGQSLRVCLRIRPLSAAEQNAGESVGIRKASEQSAETANAAGISTGRYFFDQVFDQQCSQRELFEGVVRPLLQSLFLGGSSLLFAYGVTNAGKTYTVHGVESDEGVLPRAVRGIFARIALCSRSAARGVAATGEEAEQEQRAVQQAFGTVQEFSSLVDSWDSSQRYYLGISCLEIHNDRLADLLDSRKKDLRLVDEDGEIVVKGLQVVYTDSMDKALAVVAEARARVQVAQTMVHTDSSRSHSVFFLSLCRAGQPNAQALDEPEAVSQPQRLSRLVVVDLAGSERVCRTQTTGAQLKEAGNINQSLLVLGRCLETMRHNQQVHSQKLLVPFREAKITRLFQSAFEGRGGLTVMLVHASPCARDLDE
eukprot:RCo041396